VFDTGLNLRDQLFFRVKENHLLVPVVIIVGVATSQGEVPSEKLLRAIDGSPFKTKVIDSH
jgi:hypothetical protein